MRINNNNFDLRQLQNHKHTIQDNLNKKMLSSIFFKKKEKTFNRNIWKTIKRIQKLFHTYVNIYRFKEQGKEKERESQRVSDEHTYICIYIETYVCVCVCLSISKSFEIISNLKYLKINSQTICLNLKVFEIIAISHFGRFTSFPLADVLTNSNGFSKRISFSQNKILKTKRLKATTVLLK